MEGWKKCSTDEEKKAWFSTPYTPTSADKSTRKFRWFLDGISACIGDDGYCVGMFLHALDPALLVFHPSADQHTSRRWQADSGSLHKRDAALQTIALLSESQLQRPTSHDMSSRRYPLSVSSTPLLRPASARVHHAVPAAYLPRRE